MFVDPVLRTLLRSQKPRVEVSDLRPADDTDLTVYTFLDCKLPRFFNTSGSTNGDINTTHPHLRTPSRGMLVIPVHSIASLPTWSLTSVTLGGVAGTALSRGGGANPINTGLAYWDLEALANIANSDVVVTHSKVVQSCAIGVIGVSNLKLMERIANFSTTGTGAMGATAIPADTRRDTYQWMIGATTINVAGAAVTGFPASSTGTSNPEFLYSGATAQMAFAAFFACTPGYPGNNTAGTIGMLVDWAGLDVGDFYCMGFD